MSSSSSLLSSIAASLADPLQSVIDRTRVVHPLAASHASSAEEGKPKKRVISKQSKKQPLSSSLSVLKANVDKLDDAAAAAAAAVAGEAKDLRIRTLEQVFEDNPSLCPDLSRPERLKIEHEGKGEAVPVDEREDEETPLSNTDVINAHPVVQFMNRLDRPLLVDGSLSLESFDSKVIALNQEKYIKYLENGTADIPVFLVSHENFLLHEAGRYTITLANGTNRVVTFHPCVEGKKCMGMELGIPVMRESTSSSSSVSSSSTPRGFVLMEMLSPKELKRALQDDTPPTRPRRHCLACTRVNIAGFVTSLRGSAPGFVLPRTECIQTYRNLRDQEGGYHQSHMLPLRKERDPWDGYLHPIALFTTTTMRWVRSELYPGHWCIDQGAIVVK
jgi:hypothetical protein